jgi:hypothetical protein
VKILIIDEFGMVGKRTFYHINYNLQKALNRDNVSFGGISIILCGDYN